MSEEKNELTEEQETAQAVETPKTAEPKPQETKSDTYEEVVVKLEDYQEEEEYPSEEMDFLSDRKSVV